MELRVKMKLVTRMFAVSALLFTSFSASVASAGAQVPNFSFKDANGQSHNFSEYRGKWVVANYWATYCGPCVSELPTLNNVARRYAGKVVVLGMDAGETPVGELRQFAADHHLSYPVVPTQDSTMFSMGLVYGTPTTFIVDPNGKIVGSHMGAVTTSQLTHYFRDDAPTPARKVAEKKKAECEGVIC
jgi:thiol-disulfide isomerase/thioredoxin